MEKLFFGGLDLLKPKIVTPTKMPRAALIAVVRDQKTGYLNAAPYSGGVTCVNPLHVVFGVKTLSTIHTFREADEFCAAIPSSSQVNHMWVMGLGVPKGISEIDVAGWHTLWSEQIDTPGIDECPLNLECKKIFFSQLPPPWRAVIIGEVVGVSINSSLLEMGRSEVVKLFPMHEAGSNPKTGLYGPSVLSGELIPPSDTEESQQATIQEGGVKKKTYVDKSNLYNPNNEKALINAIFPRPAYILMTTDEEGHANALPVCGGSLQSSPPTISIPVPKDTYSYKNIKRTGEFVISIPVRSLIDNFERLEKYTADDFEAAGFTLLRFNMVKVQGITECPVNIDCKTVMFEDVPGTNYAILIGRKVGVSLDKEVFTNLDKRVPDYHTLSYTNELYSKFIYAVMDQGMTRKWGFHDVNNLTVRPLPSWGSRHSQWLGYGYSTSLNYWLIELVDEGLITPRDVAKISSALALWNNGLGPAHLVEYFDDNGRNELRERLTTLFKMMAWAYRDYGKWEEVREYLCKFPAVERDPHEGPLLHDIWNGQKVEGTGLLTPGSEGLESGI